MLTFVCQSTDADYESVPVEAYGLAMLKGMGWKKGEGIGRTFKQYGPLTLPSFLLISYYAYYSVYVNIIALLSATET